MGLIKTAKLNADYREAWKAWHSSSRGSFDGEAKREVMEHYRNVLNEARTYNRGYRNGMKDAKKARK